MCFSLAEAEAEAEAEARDREAEEGELAAFVSLRGCLSRPVFIP